MDKLIEQIRADGLSVGVIAVDPSSPFSGGAILGDRVRMNNHAGDTGVFIRSMAARRALGGLASASRDVGRLFEAFGYDVVIFETVGVGQNELDVVHAVDSVLVLVAPGLGDSIQTLKAGVLEVADLFVVNMADRVEAPRTVAELRAMLTLAMRQDEWATPVLETVATEGRGIDNLWAALKQHREYLEETGRLEGRRRQRLETHVIDLLGERVRMELRDAMRSSPALDQALEGARNGRVDAHRAADEIFKRWRNGES